MRKFWGFYDNGQYKIGCNGTTMYLFDDENQLTQVQPINFKSYDFLRSYKSLQLSGFTEKSMDWSGLHYNGYTNDEILKLKDKNIDMISFHQIAEEIMK